MTTVRSWIGSALEAWRDFPDLKRRAESFPPGPPIFVTGTHRSGTTWVGRALSPPGVWHVHEPFNPALGDWPEWFTYVPEGAVRPDIDAVVRGILEGRRRDRVLEPHARHTLSPLRFRRVKPARVLVKDPIACWMSRYLTERFGFRTLVLFRHPAGFVASLRRLGWPVSGGLERCLRSDPVMEDWLSPFRSLIEEAVGREDDFARTVRWGVLTRVLWGFVTEEAALTPLFFEELCEAPLERFASLYETLDLPFDASARGLVEELSHSEPIRDQYRPHSVVRNSRAMAWRWKDELTPGQIEEIREVAARFELPIYRDERCWRPPFALPALN